MQIQGELPPEEQKHFRRLQDLTAKQRRDWIDAVRVLDQPRPKNYFFNKSFRVLGDLTDNVYVRVEMMAFWVKQLGRENAVYLETMMSLKFYKQCQLLDKEGCGVGIVVATSGIRRFSWPPAVHGYGFHHPNDDCFQVVVTTIVVHGEEKFC